MWWRARKHTIVTSFIHAIHPKKPTACIHIIPSNFIFVVFVCFLCCPSPAMRLVCISLAQHLQVFDSSVPRGYVLFCCVFCCSTVIAFCESRCFFWNPAAQVCAHHCFISCYNSWSCFFCPLDLASPWKVLHNMERLSFRVVQPIDDWTSKIPPSCCIWYIWNCIWYIWNRYHMTYVLSLKPYESTNFKTHWTQIHHDELETCPILPFKLVTSCDFLKVNPWSLLWALGKWSLVGMKAFWPCVWEANGFLALRRSWPKLLGMTRFSLHTVP